MVLIKWSILLQYLRIFVPTHTGELYRFVQVLIWSNILFYSAMPIVEIFQCIPREKIWKPRSRGHCIDISASHIGSGAVNVISDFSIFLLPLKSIWDLQIDIKPKITLSAVFTTGLL